MSWERKRWHLFLSTLTASTTSWSGGSAPVDSTETGGMTGEDEVEEGDRGGGEQEGIVEGKY